MAMMRLCSWLLVAMLMSLTVCEARGLFQRSTPDSDEIVANIEAAMERIREDIIRLIAEMQLEMAMEPSEVGCDGFPCMYTHLGAKAGEVATKAAELNALSICALDPECSPGKRRRRSAPAQAILSLLTRDEKTTS